MSLKRQAGNGSAFDTVPAIIHDVLRSPGRPLAAATRAFMEPRFGHDFSRVQVHSDARAAQAANAVNAHAFTVGHHLVFAAGQYQPDTGRGARLVAHELTHVVQQSQSGGAARQHARAISHPADAAEVEADVTAERVTRGDPAQVEHPPSAVLHAKVDVGTYIGIGFGVAAGAALIGVGIAALAGAFDRETFTDAELRAYLTFLATNRRIEDRRDSDNKARDVVRRWTAGQEIYNVDVGFRVNGAALTGVQLKRLLIQEMLTGVTGDADERSIIIILERSSSDDLLQILDPRQGVSMQDLDSSIQGQNHDRLEQVLETKFPRVEGTAARAQTAATCTARQALMINYARQQATASVDNAISLLSTRLEDPSVQRALKCRFRGATSSQIGQIRGVFERTRNELPRRVYYCGAESGPAALEATELRAPDGRRMVAECVAEDADSFVRHGGGTYPEVFLCGVFFGRSPEMQATTIVHESVHAAGLLEDPQYQPRCGIAVDTALRNPDSYAYLANDLMQLSPAVAAAGGKVAGSSLPTVTVGNFRNSGALSPENRCAVCAELPGLGLDTATGLNIMELRGDISGHRSGVEYDFKRTKERAIWRRTSGRWEMLNYEPPGTDDDRTDRDEDLTPENDHIYTIDGPGFPDLMSPLGPHTRGADEAVYKGSYVDFVHARIPPGGWIRASNEFHWHSITWLERINGSWQRRAGWNKIEPGPMMIGTGLPYGPGDYPLPSAQGKTRFA